MDKLEKYVAGGGKALVTSGFLEAAMGRGIQRMTSIRIPGRRIRGRNYRIETGNPWSRTEYPRGREEIGIPVCEFRNNATWALAKVADTEESFGLLLRDTYGKGRMLTLAVPDSFPDLYKIPKSVLTKIRSEFPSRRVYLECSSGVSLFTYDNDAYILYPYVTSQAQPGAVRIHVKDDAEALEVPLRKDFRTGEPLRIPPLYKTAGETVFEVRANPGVYELFRIL